MSAPTISFPRRPAVRPLLALARTTMHVALCAASVAATVALAALTLLPHVGARGLIVTSGSMKPAIGTGDLAVVRNVDPVAVRAGDVITYAGYTSSGLTTHRVVRPVQVNGRLHFQTQGDANTTPDADLAPAGGVLGRVVLTVPQAGRALALLNDPTARLLALGLPAAWCFLRSATAMARAVGVRQGRSVGRQVPVAALFALATAGLLVHSLHADASVAMLTDAVSIAQNTFSTGTWT